MTQLKQLWLVARFERKMLLRSWAFRIISFLCFMAAFLQVLGTLSLIYFMSAETYLGPLFTSANTTFIGLAQIGGLLTWTIVFFANDLGARDRRIGVGDVVGSRPLSDGLYVLGRMLGLLIPLTVLMVLTLVAILLLNQAFGLRGATFQQYAPFFFSFNVLSVAFTVALMTFLSTLLRNRLLTSLAGITIIIASAFLLINLSPLFDIGGFRLAGNYSDLVGYGPIAPLAMHRFTYLLLTLFLVSATVYCYPRPEGTRRTLLSTGSLAVSALASVVFVSYVLMASRQTDAQHQAWRESLQQTATNQAAGVNHYEMDMHLLPHQGAIRGTVVLALANRSETEEDTFIFVLNPGLHLDELTIANDSAASFKRNGPVVELTLGAPLSPGATVQANWKYSGTIDPHAAWLTPPPPTQDWWQQAQQVDFLMGGLSGWIGRRYAFLLPESHWYPVPNASFGHTYPDKQPKNFATAQIRLHLPEGWTGTTQGQLTTEERSGEETLLVYDADTPVPQFSLTVGEYAVAKTEVDGIQLAFFYAPLHGDNVELFADAAKELERVVSESLERIEDRLGIPYPYKSLSVAEVPSVCRSFSDSWDGRNLFVQPGVLLLSESDFFNTYFAQSYERAEERTKKEGTGATDAQIKAELLKRYFTGNAFGGDLELNLMQNYWEFQVNASGNAYPVLGSAFTASLAETALGRHQRHGDYAKERLAQPAVNVQDDGSGEKVEMRRNPFLPSVLDRGTDRELLTIPLESMAPGDQDEEFVPLVNRKTAGFLDTLALAMGDKEWKAFLPTLLDAYRFKSIEMADLEREVAAYSTQDLSWVFEQFVSSAVMPGYVIAKAEAYEIDTGQLERLFQTVVRIDNLEEGKGFVKLIIELDESSGSRTVEQDVYLTSLEAKEIRTVLSEKPKSVRLQAPYSRNVQDPMQTLYVPEEAQNVPGEDSVSTVEAVATELTVVVDDLDLGFSTVKLDKESRTRIGDAPKAGDEDEYPPYNGFWPPGRWEQESAIDAYGKYDRTRKIKKPGNGNEMAVWTASLPRAGSYEVHFFIGEKTSGQYRITVENGESTREIELELGTAREGWNSLGKYEFEADAQARVTLSDELRDEGLFPRIYADAVKWVYQETLDPVQ